MLTAIVIYLIIGLILSVWGSMRWAQVGAPVSIWTTIAVLVAWPAPVAVWCWHKARGTL